MNAMTQKTSLQIDDYLDLLNLAVHVGDHKWQKEIIRKLEYLKSCSVVSRSRQSFSVDPTESFINNKTDPTYGIGFFCYIYGFYLQVYLKYVNKDLNSFCCQGLYDANVYIRIESYT